MMHMYNFIIFSREGVLDILQTPVQKLFSAFFISFILYLTSGHVIEKPYVKGCILQAAEAIQHPLNLFGI